MLKKPDQQRSDLELISMAVCLVLAQDLDMINERFSRVGQVERAVYSLHASSPF